MYGVACYGAVIMGLLSAVVSLAQPSDTIRPNPKAVQLRQIWGVQGGATSGVAVGSGFGGLGDIFGTGYGAWVVADSRDTPTRSTWRVYPGGPEPLGTTPVWAFDNSGAVPPYHPVVGDFTGTGHNVVGFIRGISDTTGGDPFPRYFLFRTDSNRLDSVASYVLDTRMMSPSLKLYIADIQSGDLDTDGSDELIVLMEGIIRNDSIIRRSQVWIYRGGADFQVDTPTVILEDEELRRVDGRQYLVVGNLDDDRRLDLMTGCEYAAGTQKLKIFFGGPGSPWNWTTPDREIPFGDVWTLDCTGDSILDIAVPTTPWLKPGKPNAIALFRSDAGKSMRTRLLDSNDVDNFYQNTFYSYPGSAGYISDSGRRFQMLRLVTIPTLLFSGGPGGPDRFWDAYGGLEPRAYPCGDVNGDGWEDLITGNRTTNFNAGYAAIFAGGPYIPRDPSSRVRHIPSEEHEDAITVWPNPATTELHIAWRGDLRQMPRTFTIHSLDGRQIAGGTVESWRGEALWHCGDAAAGSYVVSIYDYRATLIATIQITKH